MGKYKPYSERVLRQRRTAWLRRNAGLLAVVILGILAIIAIETALLVLLTNGPLRWYLIGLAHAATVAAGLHLLHLGFLTHDREALRHIRGAWGEDNTRSELQRAKRRRLIWGWIDSITLQAGDLDHVVVTRTGGVVALDSKWRNHVTTDDAEEMARSARKAKARAEAVARTLLRKEASARHRAKTHAVTVTPAVVLWGAAQHNIPDGAMIEGVAFVAGRRLLPWLRALNGVHVDKGAAHDLLERLDDFRTTSWQE